jgi:hypothetical protein
MCHRRVESFNMFEGDFPHRRGEVKVEEEQGAESADNEQEKEWIEMIDAFPFQVFPEHSSRAHEQLLDGVNKSLIGVDESVLEMVKYFMPGDPLRVCGLSALRAILTLKFVATILACGHLEKYRTSGLYTNCKTQI